MVSLNRRSTTRRICQETSSGRLKERAFSLQILYFILRRSLDLFSFQDAANSSAILGTIPLKSRWLVAEMSPPGEDHRQLVLITGRNYLGIAHRPPWLDDGGHPCLGGQVDRIIEGKEGIGG